MAERKLPRTFSLTSWETSLFALLLDVVRNYCPTVVLRVAGGWVRDKLLGISAKDIDFTLNCLGFTFAEFVNTHLSSLGEEIHSIGRIKPNPEAGKHLETATMQIRGKWVDFTNLRPSNYSEISANSAIGTPLEDATHRDLTINSLFYNLNSDAVEDWTGRGASDLDAKIITTPKHPLATFSDDPLRVMRAIRFCGRFGFHLSEEVENAIYDTTIKKALKENIVPERIGKEVDGILSLQMDNTGNTGPWKCFQLLFKFDLLPAIFRFPPPHPSNNFKGFDELSKKKCADFITKLQRLIIPLNLISPDLDDMSTTTATTTTTTAITTTNTNMIAGTHKTDKIYFKALILATVLLPFLDYVCYPILHGKGKNKSVPVPQYILTDSLKFTHKETEIGMRILSTAKQWLSVGLKDVVKNATQNSSFPAFSREQVGLLMRETKEHWRESLILGILLLFADSQNIEAHIHIYNLMSTFIHQNNLEGVWNLKPFFNGHDLIKLLKLTEGKNVGEILTNQMCWQLNNPTASQEDCRQWLFAQYKKIAH